jgi:hypothetical protein
LNSHIGKHFGTSFSSESAVSLGPDILGTDRNITTNFFSDFLDVDLGRADNNLGLSAQSRLVEHGDEIINLLDGSITFPVSTDKELPGLDLDGRGVSPSGYFGDRGGDIKSGLHGFSLGKKKIVDTLEAKFTGFSVADKG